MFNYGIKIQEASKCHSNHRRKMHESYNCRKQKHEALKFHQNQVSFKGKPTRWQIWFKLDTDSIEGNVMTGEPYFFIRIYQKHIPGQADKYWITFYVSIWIAKQPNKF